MPTYRLQGPDGQSYDITAPEGATMEQVQSVAMQHIGGAPQEDYDPTDGMSTGELALAGIGKGMVDLGRGAGQALGLVSREDIQRSRELDEPLMRTRAGTAGAIGGTIAGALPAAFVPGANTMLGAAGVGAGLGFLQPSTSAQETIKNTAVSGVLGPIALGAGRLVGAGYNLVRSGLYEPFTNAGQDAIAARVLQRFAGGEEQAATAAQAARNAAPSAATPTLAEIANNGGVAQLERSLRNNPDLASAFTERLQGNRSALLEVLQRLGGTDAEMAAAEAARRSNAAPLYAAAESRAVPLTTELESLLARPSAGRAAGRADQLLAERGIAPTEELTGQRLHYLKMAMDDMLTPGQPGGIVGNEARAVADTRSDLLSALEDAVPEYRLAREGYARDSAPINQMEIGRYLAERFQPALADYGSVRSTPATFARALRDGDATAARATGRPNATLENTLTPQQLADVEGVAEALGRRANADELGRAPGSPTAQNLVSQNLLRQVLGPLGLPESIAENTLAQTVMRPFQFAGQLSEPRVLSRLGNAMLNPDDGIALLERANGGQLAQLAERSLPYGASALRSGIGYTVSGPGAQEALAAYKNGTATPQQLAILEAAAQRGLVSVDPP